MKKYLVLDVGGSAIKYAVMDAEKNIYERGKVPTPLDCLDSFVNSVQSLYNTYSDVSGIAMSMPGRIDPNKGYCFTGGALTYIHDINMAASYCSHIVMMKDGKIFCSGKTHDVMTQENLTKVYEVEFEVLANPVSGKKYFIPYNG